MERLDTPGHLEEGPLRIGDTFLGKYQILSVVGRGGHGYVYQAVNLFMGRYVALKVLDRKGGLTEELRRRGQLEAALLGRFEHPNLVKVFDAGLSEDGQLYIIMELLQGCTLAAWLQERGPLDVREGLKLLEALCSALVATHAENAVHRDLKPANIFLAKESGSDVSVPKILDFGVAKIVGAAGWQTERNRVVGTCLYMSPEQIQGLTATPRSDLYCLGLVAFEALFGSHPLLVDEPSLDLSDRRMVALLQVKKVPKRLDDLIPGFPDYVARLVHTALVKRPGQRFASAAEMAAKVREYRERYLRERGAATRSRLAVRPVSLPGAALGGVRFRPSSSPPPVVAQESKLTTELDGAPNALDVSQAPPSSRGQSPHATATVKDMAAAPEPRPSALTERALGGLSKARKVGVVLAALAVGAPAGILAAEFLAPRRAEPSAPVPPASRQVAARTPVVARETGAAPGPETISAPAARQPSAQRAAPDDAGPADERLPSSAATPARSVLPSRRENAPVRAPVRPTSDGVWLD